MSNEELCAQDALQAWLAKIGFNRVPRPDLATLRELQRRHVLAFPYETLDPQVGRTVTRDPRDAFAKMIGEVRGGCCYEFNGLFGWMLETIGFQVRYLVGAVLRGKAGDKAIGNHLVPLVGLDRPYVADVAMGHFEPVPLVEGPVRQGWRHYSLERLEDGWWRFHNHPGQLPPSFDFTPELTDEGLLERACRWLQSDPSSPFVRHPLIQRHFPDRIETLTGRMHSILTAAGELCAEVPTRPAYEKLARETFGVEVPDVRAIWARISVAPQPGFLMELSQSVTARRPAAAA
jgi:N-hydroxyarylamine O-acetyltransferase